MTTFFPADGGWRDFTKPVMRQIGVALVLPVVLFVVFGRFSTAVWMVAAIGSAVAVLLTQLRRSWGRGIDFQQSSVRVSRRDGSTLEIANANLSHVILKTDCFGLVWQEGAKRRSLVVARESFSPATWERALEGARALQQSLASAKVATT